MKQVVTFAVMVALIQLAACEQSGNIPRGLSTSEKSIIEQGTATAQRGLDQKIDQRETQLYREAAAARNPNYRPKAKLKNSSGTQTYLSDTQPAIRLSYPDSWEISSIEKSTDDFLHLVFQLTNHSFNDMDKADLMKSDVYCDVTVTSQDLQSSYRNPFMLNSWILLGFLGGNEQIVLKNDPELVQYARYNADRMHHSDHTKIQKGAKGRKPYHRSQDSFDWHKSSTLILRPRRSLTMLCTIPADQKQLSQELSMSLAKSFRVMVGN